MSDFNTSNYAWCTRGHTSTKFKHDVSQFTGSLNHHRFSALSKSALTDGAKFVADELQAYWLFDAIASHIDYGMAKQHDMYFSTLDVHDGSAKLVIDDGDGNVLASQDFDCTNFPYDMVDKIEIWSAKANGYHVHYLPSEH